MDRYFSFAFNKFQRGLLVLQMIFTPFFSQFILFFFNLYLHEKKCGLLKREGENHFPFKYSTGPFHLLLQIQKAMLPCSTNKKKVICYPNQYVTHFPHVLQQNTIHLLLFYFINLNMSTQKFLEGVYIPEISLSI